MRIEFLQTCEDSKLIPKFLKFRIPKNGCFNKNMTATADLSSPWVGASPPAVFRSKNGARIYKHYIKKCRADSSKPRFGILGVDLYRKSS